MKISLRFPKYLTVLALSAATIAISAPAIAQTGTSSVPSLIITNEPLPDTLRRSIYSKPVRVRAITPSEVLTREYYKGGEQTLVGRKVNDITSELARIQNDVANVSATLNGLERGNEERAAAYYANIATINTQLQSGTTPGNPRLVARLGDAENHLETVSSSVNDLNGVAVETSRTASEAAFLLEETRAAYNLSGAIEEDHVRLQEVEDSINNTIIIIQRVLNTVNDDITRTSTYLSAEQENLRVLSLAVANGDFYGRSFSDRPFSAAADVNGNIAAPNYGGPTAAPAAAVSTPSALSGPRPLAKITFDRPDVDFEEPVFLAVNEALKRYPNARFDLVAVAPTQGNAAQVAIESTKARRNAEKVLRTLTQMGLSQDRVDLAYNEDASASSSQVHLLVK